MTPHEVVLITLVAALVVVALIALRFPGGRRAWPLDARQTVGILVSGLTAVLVFALLVVATRDLRWPPLVPIVFTAVVLGLALLLGTALLLPEGLRARP